jgi:hypothetical protein
MYLSFNQLQLLHPRTHLPPVTMTTIIAQIKSRQIKECSMVYQDKHGDSLPLLMFMCTLEFHKEASGHMIMVDSRVDIAVNRYN